MKRLILVGGGHAHVQVLKHWIEAPPPGVELIVVSPSAHAPYSGMVPGWLAGIYTFDDICMDVAALARSSTARFVNDDVTALDPAQRVLHLRHHPALNYDVLSLNIGSTLFAPESLAGTILCMRPLSALDTRWRALLTLLSPTEVTQRRVIAAGGGPAAVESLLAVLARLRSQQPLSTFKGLLVTRDSEILRGHAPGAQRAMLGELTRVGASVICNTDASTFETRASDIVLWATGAQAHAWPRDSGLATDPAGFVTVDAQLRSVSHPNVYAVGDCASWKTPLPKAGVIAVRMGPVLVQNLRAALGHGAATEYRPQRFHLALLSTAHRTAVASWNGFSARGAWVWRWKDHIDRKFLRRFSVAK